MMIDRYVPISYEDYMKLIEENLIDENYLYLIY